MNDTISFLETVYGKYVNMEEILKDIGSFFFDFNIRLT